MYISELELHGFKSFANKTEVKFDSGITAIVGPNGCGKSNIVDALRWVLGEQRPTLLRSSNMTNVIFNGTKDRKPLGMAEVSLTLVNNQGVLPTEYNEITISRRLYRSGDSEYLINNTTCRLKDIMELFMDTGMGADAYSVIELSMVDEILHNKSDRRRLFEEAAGITKYKDKRKQTYRKLEETKDDLQRVEDLLVEVKNKVNSLKSQAAKARKAKEYRKELTRLDKAVNHAEYLNIKEELDPLDKRIENAENEKKEIENKLSELEDTEEKARRKLNEKEQKQAEAQRRVNQLEKKIQDTKTELQIKKEKISNEESVIEQYSDDIEQANQDLEELREVFERNSNKLDQFQKELDKAEENLEKSETRFNNIQQEYTEEKEALSKINQRFDQTNKELNKLQTRKIKLESRLENTDEERERIEEEQEELRNEIETYKGERKLLKDKLEKQKEERDDAEQRLEEAHARREELNTRQNELKDKIRSLQSKKDAIESEIDLLRDIADSNEAYPGSVQYLMEEHRDSFSLLAPVSEIFSTDEEYAVALESVLDDATNYLVAETLKDAEKAIQLLKEQDKGTATIIPLDQLSTGYEVDEESLYHKVESEQKFDALKQLLLGKVHLLNSEDEAHNGLDDGKSGVTPDGMVITSEGFLQGGSLGQNVGMRVGLDDKIEKMQGKAETIGNQIEETRDELETKKEAYQSLNTDRINQELKDKSETVQEVKQKINSYSTQIDMHQKNVRELNQRQEKLGKKKESAKEELEQMYPEQKELQQKLRELDEEKKEKEETLQNLEEERNIAQNRYNDAKLKHQDLKNKVENHEKEIARAENGIQNLKQRLEDRNEKSSKARERIEEFKNRIETLKGKQDELKDKKKEADQELEEIEKACGQQRGKIKEIEDDKEEVQNRKEVNVELIHHLNMAKNKFEMQAKNISDYIWEEYELLMDQIEERLPEDQEIEEAKERKDKLREKLNNLGEVNPLAIKEYEEEKERLDFYEQQIDDLTEAEEQLRETIREINETATEKFNVTFEQIRDNFKKVFHTLFDETDNCDLILEEDEEDPLNSKITIKANPRGKRPTTINQLSGGEKTLTAIALLFAIYLVKPSPFCVLDEVDAPLDDANVERFANMIKQFSEDTQFIIITHNKKTMTNAERMYGITMPDAGVSQLVAVQLDDVAVD